MELNLLKNLEAIYITSCIEHDEGTESGDYRKANRAAKKIYATVTELKKNNKLEFLFRLLDHENESVKLWSSSYLLDIDQDEQAITTLKSLIGIPKSLVSFSAKVTLDEWQKGTLRMYSRDNDG
jgi:hypothetical protein